MRYLLLLTFSLVFFSCSIKKEIYVLPNGYQGKVCIFYNQSLSKGDVKRDGNNIVYYVPLDGVIFTKTVPSDLTDLQFCYQNMKTDIEYVLSYELLSEKTVVYGGRKGWLTLSDDSEVLYNSFYVGNKKTIDSIDKVNSEEYLEEKYNSIRTNKCKL